MVCAPRAHGQRHVAAPRQGVAGLAPVVVVSLERILQGQQLNTGTFERSTC